MFSLYDIQGMNRRKGSTTHAAVAHNWINQTGKGTHGFAMFYEGKTLYSYGHHFPLGHITTNIKGERVILLNSGSYSVSTVKHKLITWRASRTEKTFDVPDVMAASPRDHEANHAAILAWAEESEAKASRARKHKQSYLETAQRQRNTAKQYAKEFLA